MFDDPLTVAQALAVDELDWQIGEVDGTPRPSAWADTGGRPHKLNYAPAIAGLT